LLEAELEALGLASREQIEAIRAQVEVEIRKGVAFAEASPVPSAEDLLRDVYTT
jgi:pyruvate dehydrogenase E1 component alpha subunit